MKIVSETPVVQSARVMQAAGLFDLPTGAVSRVELDVDLSLELLASRPWSVGLIVGPSGSGKSTVARRLFPDLVGPNGLDWPDARSVLDAFPTGLGIKEITGLLSSVGFSSPPAWLRPYRCLSTGEQFRVTVARALAEQPGLCVVDEFTSVVDRTVAQVGSAAVAKAVRARGGRFVAVTCHEDVEAWLDPDWVYRPATNDVLWRSLRGRPEIELRVCRVPYQSWAVFRRHHYLDSEVNRSAVCFGAFWRDRLVAFNAWLPLVSGTRANTKRGHRTVTLPDYQGVGIGNALSEYCAALWRGLGYGAVSRTSHPSMIAHRSRSPLWRMTVKPSFSARNQGTKTAFNAAASTARYSAGFEYVGPALPADEATRVHACWALA